VGQEGGLPGQQSGHPQQQRRGKKVSFCPYQTATTKRVSSAFWSSMGSLSFCTPVMHAAMINFALSWARVQFRLLVLCLMPYFKSQLLNANHHMKLARAHMQVKKNASFVANSAPRCAGRGCCLSAACVCQGYRVLHQLHDAAPTGYFLLVKS